MMIPQQNQNCIIIRDSNEDINSKVRKESPEKEAVHVKVVKGIAVCEESTERGFHVNSEEF